MRTLKLALLISLFAGANAFAKSSANCQARQDSRMNEDSKVVKTAKATATVWGNPQSNSGKKPQAESSKTNR